jgi:hypothetical protein
MTAADNNDIKRLWVVHVRADLGKDKRELRIVV